MRDWMVSVSGLTRDFDEGSHRRIVLDGLDLRIARGECVALLGRSGSGKSTLLNLVSGIDRPSAGEVVIDGQALTAMDERRRTLFRRRHIGFVHQFFNLIPTLTAEENLRLPLELNGLRDDDATAHWLEAIGLADHAHHYPDTLSAGEQQRIAIARALIHRPRLVLADEPTGNLDADTGRRVLALLAEQVRRQATTLLIVTHSKQVAGFADRVLTLEGGRVTARGMEMAW